MHFAIIYDKINPSISLQSEVFDITDKRLAFDEAILRICSYTNIDNRIQREYIPGVHLLPREMHTLEQNMHLNTSCGFYFHSPEVQCDFMETYARRLRPGQCVKREMACHCADVYQMSCHVISEVLPGDAGGLIEKARALLAARYVQDF